MRSLHRSALASTVSLVLVGALGVAVAAPAAQAAAPDAATTAVTDLFGRLASDFLPQVASSTALARQLPTLAVTPAESVGLKTAFSDAARDRWARWRTCVTRPTLADLADYVDDADGSGWTFTSATPDDHSLTIGFTRVVESDAGLDVRDDDGTLSLSTGGGIDVVGTLTGSFTFVHDATAGQAVLTHPSLAIATSADLPGGKQLDAGLGILGVRVTGTADGTDYRLESTVATSWANPDNDAAGSLAYDNPGTATADDGELAAAGAGTGIVTTTRTGVLTGHLVAVPRPSTLVDRAARASAPPSTCRSAAAGHASTLPP